MNLFDIIFSFTEIRMKKPSLALSSGCPTDILLKPVYIQDVQKRQCFSLKYYKSGNYLAKKISSNIFWKLKYIVTLLKISLLVKIGDAKK